jgi:WD40 repeat protein
VLALACHRDSQRGLHVVSAGADGTLALWRLPAPGAALQLQARVKLDGAPVFSLLSTQGCLFAGMASRDVRCAAWADVLVLGLASMQRACGGHTGWVKALVADGDVLLSVGCNFVRAWELGSLAPLGQARLFTGDVLALAARQTQLFSGGADGSMHRFALRVDERPAVVLAQSVKAAHDGRVEALSFWGAQLASAGRDGALRVHTADTLLCTHEQLHAHGVGAVIHCLAADGADAMLSGGADGCVRRWVLPPPGEQELARALMLMAVGRSAPASPVRALLRLQPQEFGALCAASGHQDGMLRLWRV